MDEMVTVNLVCVFLRLSPFALLTTFPFPACTIPSPALIIPFPPVNKLPNKVAPKVPSNMLKNPPLCSLVSFQLFYLLLLIKYQNFLELQ